jgi:enterochelin esterase-like enzyme
VIEPLAWRVPRPPWLTVGALDARRAADEPFPVVADGTCTFAFIGTVISVHLTHFGVGLPADLGFEPVADSEWWTLTLAVPEGSRLEYKLTVADSFGTHLVEDPLNPTTARHPFGANSVCEAAGYVDPEWAHPRPGAPAGRLGDLVLDSQALGRRAGTTVYHPVGFDDRAGDARYPLLVVHDGGDYLHYAALAAVLDNLIADGRLPPLVAVLLYPDERLVEYADDPRHHAYLTRELVPHLERELPLVATPSARCLMGASFGAVAALSAAYAAPGTFGRLLVQSGSFAGAGTGCWPRPEALWQPVKALVRRFIADPRAVAERVYVSCGVYESLICENRGFVPVLGDTGMEVRFDETRDGHNWPAWRNVLGEALPYLFGP